MIKGILIAISILTTTTLIAQETDWLTGWTEAEIAEANTAKNVTYLTQAEKDVFLYSNLARLNPPKFERTILKEYLKVRGFKVSRYTKSLISTLKRTKPMAMLQPKEDLYKHAQYHAKDMGRSGKVGHKSSKGKSFKKRFEKLAQSYYGVGENCQYGWDQGVDIVVDLLIDLNVPDYGHRKNILQHEFTYLGVSIAKHKKYEWNCVQNFGGDFNQ